MKPKFDTSLALAFAAFGVPSMPPPPPLPPEPPRTPRRWPTGKRYIQPPPPPLASAWTFVTYANERKVYIDSIDSRTGQPCVIPMTLLTHHAILTSEAGHAYELTAMPGKGSSVKSLSPADRERRCELEAQISAITAAPEAVKLTKKGEEKPCLSDAQKRQVSALRDGISRLGMRHLPADTLADLTRKVGTAEAQKLVDFLLPPVAKAPAAPAPAPSAPRNEFRAPAKPAPDYVWKGEVRYPYVPAERKSKAYAKQEAAHSALFRQNNPMYGPAINPEWIQSGN